MSLILYKIQGKEIIQTEELTLENDKIYVIIDKHAKRAKIWIWSGSGVKSFDKYFAGVSATKIKSKLRLYGASIEVVESGNEPEGFPIITKDAIVKLKAKKAIITLDEQITFPVQNEIKVSKESSNLLKTEEIEPSTKSGLISISKVKSILMDISMDFEKLLKKINNYISEL